MSRIMYDGVTASSVPGDGWAVAGYVNGSWPSYAALAAAYPHLVHVSISVNNQGTAMVLDVEKGDATPQQAPAWVQRMRRAGIQYPVVYMSASAWQTVKDEFSAQGVAQPLYWVAKYDGDPTLPSGAIAKQFLNTAGYDKSVVADYWPGIDPVPHPPVTPEDDMAPYYSVQVLPDAKGTPNACGVCTWPNGVVHAFQLEANPGVWGDTQGEFRLVFQQTTGPDVTSTIVAETAEKVSLELSSVAGLVVANCSGVFITRPDGKTWPWGGGAV